MTTPVPTCASCKFCVLGPSKNPNEATCSQVVDPLTGANLPVRTARLDTWQGYQLPCTYKGLLWAQ